METSTDANRLALDGPSGWCCDFAMSQTSMSPMFCEVKRSAKECPSSKGRVMEKFQVFAKRTCARDSGPLRACPMVPYGAYAVSIRGHGAVATTRTPR